MVVIVVFQMVKDIAKDLFLEVIQEHCTEMSSTLVRAAKWYLDQSVAVTGEFISSNLNPIMK